MNKRADIEISVKTLIGFILVALIFFSFVGLFVKLWGIFLSNPNEPTINSFENLVYEIRTLEEGDQKIVPFYIQKGLKLTTDDCQQGNIQVKEDICICLIDGGCKKRVIAKEYAEGLALEVDYEIVSSPEGTFDLVLANDKKTVTISEK